MKNKKTILLVALIVIILIVVVSILIIANKSKNSEGTKNNLIENSDTTYLSISELNVNENCEGEYVGTIKAVPELISANFPLDFEPLSEGIANPMAWYTDKKDGTSVVLCSIGLTSGKDNTGDVVSELDAGSINEQVYKLAKYFKINKINVNSINGTVWYTIIVDDFKGKETGGNMKKGYYSYTEKNGKVFLVSYEIFNGVSNKDAEKAIEYYYNILDSVKLY